MEPRVTQAFQVWREKEGRLGFQGCLETQVLTENLEKEDMLESQDLQECQAHLVKRGLMEKAVLQEPLDQEDFQVPQEPLVFLEPQVKRGNKDTMAFLDG